MIVIIAFLIGATVGAYTAHRRGGKLADILHYATVFAIAFTLAGLFLTLFIDRMT